MAFAVGSARGCATVVICAGFLFTNNNTKDKRYYQQKVSNVASNYIHIRVFMYFHEAVMQECVVHATYKALTDLADEEEFYKELIL